MLFGKREPKADAEVLAQQSRHQRTLERVDRLVDPEREVAREFHRFERAVRRR